MLTMLLAVFATACLLFLNRGMLTRWNPFFAAALLAFVCLFFFGQIDAVGIRPQFSSFDWVPSLGASIDLRLDGLSLLFAILISGIGAGVFVYSASYMHAYKNLAGFYATLLTFTGAMLGMVLSDNMIVFFIFWELTSLCSFLLIGFKSSIANTRESARRAMFITVGGGLFLLVAVCLLTIVGLQSGLALAEAIRFSNIDQGVTQHAYYPWIVCLVATAVATKSAQFPFHIWLPAAMAGPTPVSSFLHSATMVKAGVFLLMRLTPSLGGTDLWVTIFVTMGSVTMLGSALLAASQRDIKKILAYSTISVLGILVMLFGIGTELSIKAGVVFLVAHALYKASLFQIIGTIDHATGSRDIYELGNLARFMPVLAVAALLSALSMAGSPPLFGFFGKELAYLAKVNLGGLWLVLIVVAVLTNALMVALAVSICFRPFWTQSRSEKILSAEAAPWPMSLVPFVLASLGLLIGLFPGLFDKYLGSPMASAVAGKELVMKLKLWHGFNTEAMVVLSLSILTLALGFIAAVKLRPLMSWSDQLRQSFAPFGPDQLYERWVQAMPVRAKRLTELLQNGHLSHYLRITLIGILAFLLVPLWQILNRKLVWTLDGWMHLCLVLFIALPVLLSINLGDRLKQFILIGSSGFGIVAAFVFFAAPDLALTQLMVETLSVVFLIGLIRGVPREQRRRLNRRAHIVLAAIFATALLLLLATPTYQLADPVSEFYQAAAYAEAYGRNIVNVILVDFRALDTFGEITVVGIATLGVGALLRSQVLGRKL